MTGVLEFPVVIRYYAYIIFTETTLPNGKNLHRAAPFVRT
jgi:hypothetical protein